MSLPYFCSVAAKQAVMVMCPTQRSVVRAACKCRTSTSSTWSWWVVPYSIHAAAGIRCTIRQQGRRRRRCSSGNAQHIDHNTCACLRQAASHLHRPATSSPHSCVGAVQQVHPHGRILFQSMLKLSHCVHVNHAPPQLSHKPASYFSWYFSDQVAWGVLACCRSRRWRTTCPKL